MFADEFLICINSAVFVYSLVCCCAVSHLSREDLCERKLIRDQISFLNPTILILIALYNAGKNNIFVYQTEEADILE